MAFSQLLADKGLPRGHERRRKFDALVEEVDRLGLSIQQNGGSPEVFPSFLIALGFAMGAELVDEDEAREILAIPIGPRVPAEVYEIVAMYHREGT